MKHRSGMITLEIGDVVKLRSGISPHPILRSGNIDRVSKQQNRVHLNGDPDYVTYHYKQALRRYVKNIPVQWAAFFSIDEVENVADTIEAPKQD